MHIGEEFYIFGFEWARIHFVENNGMAFGLEFGGSAGKLFLSIFRIIAVAFLAYYIRELIKMRASFGLLVCFGLILAGALGNIIDSAFYGLIFSEGYHQVATMFPEEGGYAPFLYGRVVDMLYFPMFRGTFPESFPFWGGEPFLFFRPVFNIADTSITIGVISLLLFYRSFFNGHISNDLPADLQTATSEATQDEKSEEAQTETALTENTNAKDGSTPPDSESKEEQTPV